MTPTELERLLGLLTRWADAQPEISCLALVGSWARGTARADSDVDLIILTSSPRRYREDPAWPSALGLEEAGFQLIGWRDADYGAIWSRHMKLSPEAEVEIGFGSTSWAATDPMDEGTRRVASDGLRILLDREGRLARLSAAIG